MAVRLDIFPPRYQDVRHLAHGGMGNVYSATDTVLGRTVALKLLAERFSDDEDIRRRFKNEALAAARLSNAPFTVTIFDVGETEEQPFIVMELLEGGSLEERLKDERPSNADAFRWLGQAAEALDAGHAAGVIHRDVKPGNLLLDGRDDVHVADFGVASAVGLDSMTMTGMVLGTAGYLSPEQARGERATAASDRYGLAVVAWELLTGARPYESESPTAEAAAHVNAPVPPISRAGDLPPELDAVFHRALAKDPGTRPGSAGEFVADLRAALERSAATTGRLAAVEEERYTPPAAMRPARSRSLLWLALLVGALAAIAGGFALGGMLSDDEPSTRTVTSQGQVTTVEETVTAEPPPPPPPPTATAPPPPPPPSNQSGQQLTDRATRLLGRERWQEAETVSRQAVAKLEGSGELYEAYANYNLGRALVEQDRCDEALPHLDRSEQIQGSRREIRDARARCQ